MSRSAPAECLERARRAGRVPLEPTLTNPLSFGFPLFTRGGVFCLQAGLRSEAVCEEKAMHLTSLHYLFLIPVGLALAFMGWFLWSVSRQLANGRTMTEKQQPMISIRVRDRYSMETPAEPTRKIQIANPAARTPAASRENSLSSSREFSYVPPSPILGPRLRPASSSAGRDGRR